MKNSLLIVFTFVLVIMAACATEATDTPEVIETVPADFAGKTNPYGREAATPGAEVFQAYCASCHGETGHGDGPAGMSLVPPPKDISELQARVEDDYLFWRVSTGKSGTAMVGWSGILSDEQIWQVVSFIRTLK